MKKKEINKKSVRTYMLKKHVQLKKFLKFIYVSSDELLVYHSSDNCFWIVCACIIVN